MRKWVLLMVTIVIMTIFAGCLGGEAENKGSSGPVLVPKQGTITQISGWAESNWADEGSGPWIVNLAIPIDLNDTNIVQVKFSIKVEDSDADHAESDEGSDPDQVQVSIAGDNTTDGKEGATPAQFQIEVKAQASETEANYLSETWTIQLNAECYGGKMYKVGPIPVPTRTYKDQGVAYTISGDYSYMVEQGTV